MKAILDPISSKTATASNVFAVMRRLFSWSIEHEDLERSPLEGMKPPPLPASRDRVLSDDELRLIWQGSEKLGYPFGPMVQLLILTGARREEVAAMEWEELDRDRRAWSLPVARSKNDVSAVQPLSEKACAVLSAMAGRARKDGKWPKKGFVFSTTGETTVSGYSRAKRRLDREIRAIAEKAKVAPPESWRLHDLRRTLATGLQRLGVRLEVTEAVLNHVSGSRSGIVGIYQRYNWAEEKREGLEAWGTQVRDLLPNGAS